MGYIIYWQHVFMDMGYIEEPKKLFGKKLNIANT